MPIFKINLDLNNSEKLKKIAKNTFNEDSDFAISILLNRFLKELN